MLGCIGSRFVHPRRSRGHGPGSIQHRLGHTGDICWAKPGPNPRSIPRTAVAMVKDRPHSALGAVKDSGRSDLARLAEMNDSTAVGAVHVYRSSFIFGLL